MNHIWIEEEWQEKIAQQENWFACQRKKYAVSIQKAVRDKEYNVPGRPGYLYNCLEDSVESLESADYIVTGLLGEMWPITEKNLASYDVEGITLSEEPKQVFTKAATMIHYALQIPVEVPFAVEVSWCGKLNGNARAEEIPHGTGDYLVCTTPEEGDYRIVNGAVFKKMYERVENK